MPFLPQKIRRSTGIAAIAATMLTAACVTEEGSGGYRGKGYDSKTGEAHGSMTARSDGGYTFTLSRDGAVCSARYSGTTRPGTTEMSALTCSGGANGTATVVYGADAKPSRIVYAVNGSGGGAISF